MASGGTGEQSMIDEPNKRYLQHEQMAIQINTRGPEEPVLMSPGMEFDNEGRDRFEEQSSVASNYSMTSGERNQRFPSSITGSKMSRGKQKISADSIIASSPLREAMLFLALASSTMQHFAMVILIPFMAAYEHDEVKSFEIGLLIGSAWAGSLIAGRFTEPAISKMGTKWAMQLAFLFMVAASFAFWLVTSVVNDSEFMAFTFLSRFLFGFGSGLLRSVIIIARAQSKKGQKDVQARDYFRWHMQAEAVGYFLGPLLLVITNHSRWENSRTALWLALSNMIVWFLFTVCFVDNINSREQQHLLNDQQAGTGSRGDLSEATNRRGGEGGMPAFNNLGGGFTMADSFIKSLLYNQVPMTAFLNRRAMLAFFALLVGFILVTFMLPFFALIRNRSSYEVSIQLTAALAVFFVASLLGSYLMACTGPKRFTTLSLILATGACFLLGLEANLDQKDKDPVDPSETGMRRAIDTIVMLADNAILGYMLILISIALLTIASLEEVLSGTENKLLRTKFVNASNLHLFVESTFMVYAIVQFAHIIGPIIGGMLNTELGMAKSCQMMGWIGAFAIFLYLGFALWVHCTLYEENTISLTDLDIDDDEPIENQFMHGKSTRANQALRMQQRTLSSRRNGQGRSFVFGSHSHRRMPNNGGMSSRRNGPYARSLENQFRSQRQTNGLNGAALGRSAAGAAEENKQAMYDDSVLSEMKKEQ